MKYDLVIKNATVLTTEPAAGEGPPKMLQQELHIGVADGKISSLSSAPLVGETEIDARGLHVLPGVIDSQVHFREPGLTYKEDIESGTRAAAKGGVTSIFEMPNTYPPTINLERLQDKMQLAANRAWVNYAFFGGASLDNVQDLPELERADGCPGIKIFMGSSTGSLLVDKDDVLEEILRRSKRRVIVHSEDEERLKARKQIAIDAKNVQAHPIWRDVQTAVLSTEKLLRLARKTGARIHVLHVTSEEEVELLKKNQDIATFEVTPNHLMFHAPDCYERWGTKVMMNPPIRDERHQKALWRAIQDGTATLMGTDHAPHTLEEKAKEYPTCPSGMPGVQTLVPLLLTWVNEGRLSLFRMIELLCENPRKVFGCNSKGRIWEGYDADFTIVDLKKNRTIDDAWIVSKVGWTPFAGFETKGFPTHTIVGGHLVMQEDQLVLAGQGQKVLFSNY